ncbi:MAG TPA: hypothetical protein VF144_12755 [Chitinophagaceae bacterium]
MKKIKTSQWQEIMIVNHENSTREFYYQEKTNASLNAAAKNKWHVVNMKNDWKEIFAK